MSEYDVTIHDQGDLARIAELEALSNTSICIFCGTTMDKDLNVMLDHAEGCEKRPENNLLKRAEQAEAALAERDRMLRLAVGDEWVSNGWNRADAEDDPGFAGEIDALRTRAEEGIET